ncbi:MAG: PQQ-binding-like beta-propeller repeat protein [Planctomycetota bacterium]|jgi:outer membrane protein assembly factor BamB
MRKGHRLVNTSLQTRLSGLIIALAANSLTLAQAPTPTARATANWPHWRGPLENGNAPQADPPLNWSEKKNITWKIDLPGRGHATPIIWDNQIFLTTAIPYGEKLSHQEVHDHHHDHEHDHGAHDNFENVYRQRFDVIAIDRNTGNTIWQKTVSDTLPHEGTHVTGSWASNSSVTNGKHLYAYFGSRGLYCMDFQGNVIWQKQFGQMKTRHGHGEGSSPAIAGNNIIVNWDHEGDSFITALDKTTGQEKWRKPRKEMTSWSSPHVLEHNGQTQVIISATDRTRAYNADNGDVLWECAGLSRNVVASPVSGDGMVYFANSYDWQAIMAVRLDKARGDITGTDAIAWKRDRHTPYVPSPLLYGDNLYYLKHNQGFLTCLDAATGKLHYDRQRLEEIDRVFASPVAASGRIYIASRNGNTIVIENGPQFRTLALNTLDDSFSASPVIVNSELYLRGDNSLYRIENTP